MTREGDWSAHSRVDITSKLIWTLQLAVGCLISGCSPQETFVCGFPSVVHLYRFVPGLPPTHAEVGAFVQWAKCVRSDSGEKAPLYINMDETSVAFHFGKQRGFVIRKRSLPPGKAHRKEKRTTGDAKANMSFLAFMTHNADIQVKLPQIFICNKNQIPAKTLKDIGPLPENFYLWREDSAWNSHAKMRRAMCHLVKHLKDYQGTHQIILVMDVAKCHFDSTIFSLATRQGIRLLYVPAKLTWLLQPADTHAFSLLKRRLRKAWMTLVVEGGTGEIQQPCWVREMFLVTKKLFTETDWHSSFESNGLLDESRLSQRILQQIGLDTPMEASSNVLTAEQLKLIFPRRAKVSHESVFRWALPKALPKAKPGAKSMAKPKAKPKVLAGSPPCHGSRKKKAAPALD